MTRGQRALLESTRNPNHTCFGDAPYTAASTYHITLISSNIHLLPHEGKGEVRKPLLLVKQIRSEGSELAVEKEFPSYSERVSVAKRSGRALPGA